MKTLLLELARGLVTEPERVSVREELDGDLLLLELSVAPADRGRVIGKRGATADALRNLLEAVGEQRGLEVDLEILG